MNGENFLFWTFVWNYKNNVNSKWHEGWYQRKEVVCNQAFVDKLGNCTENLFIMTTYFFLQKTFALPCMVSLEQDGWKQIEADDSS